tara:strand:- start:90 stop:464 length:375 start_codon:yes stop_codon:yes gene_type:complete
MEKAELKRLIKEELEEVFRGFGTPNDSTSQLSPEANIRIFSNLKKKAEELYTLYTKSGRVPGMFGDRDIKKWESIDELNKISEWYEVWSRTLETAKTYNDLIQTLDLLPIRLQSKFKTQLLKVK